MTKTKTTKRALIASVLSLLVCFSMLIGSTFAWFTDSATTGVNKIQAGKLDVDLVDAKGDTLVGKTLKFTDKDDNALWEPGCTYTLDDIYVVNKGNLALKYQIVISGINGDAKLNDAIEWTIEGTADSYLLPNGKSSAIKIKGHMKEDAGNEYQGLSIDGISITVNATQYTYEKDSINDQYDKIAFVKVSSQKELEDAIKNATEATAISMSDGTYTLPTMSNKDITFFGAENTTINMLSAVNASGSVLTFNGIKVVFDNDNYKGLQHSKKVTYENCALVGTQFLYAPEVVFTNCTFDMYNEKTEYSVWTYGSENVSFTDCTFTTNGKAILVYNEVTDGNFVADVTLDSCVLSGNGTFNDKAAIETGSNANNTETSNRYNITVNNTTVIGFARNSKGTQTNSTIWANKNSMDSAHLKVVVTNSTEHSNWKDSTSDKIKEVTDDTAKTVTISTAEQLAAFAASVNKDNKNYAGYTVKLAADIDLMNGVWAPIGQTGATQFLGTFDGNGHTIKNLNIDSSAQTGGTYSSGLFGWIERHGEDADYLMAVKNLTIDNATVKGNHNVAVIAGYLIGTINNCHVKNADVVCKHANDDACGDKAGVIAGIAAEAKALIKDCTAADSTVTAGRDAGQIVGACIVGKVENCKATNVTVSATGDCTGKNISNAIIGRTN